jgi:hypothetical protein
LTSKEASLLAVVIENDEVAAGDFATHVAPSSVEYS